MSVNDLIEREAVLEHYRVTDPAGTFVFCDSILDFVQSLPPAQPKTGKWIKISSEIGAARVRVNLVQCSVCEWVHPMKMPKKFCPNCGTPMEE